MRLKVYLPTYAEEILLTRPAWEGSMEKTARALLLDTTLPDWHRAMEIAQQRVVQRKRAGIE